MYEKIKAKTFRSEIGIFWLRWNSGFLMVPEVILVSRLNLPRNVECVYVHYNSKLLTLCDPATITSAILYQFNLSEVILEICLNLRRKVECVYVHYNRELLTLCAPAAITSAVYTHSVCPELAWRHTVWKWSSVGRIHAFCGGLQARLWACEVSWHDSCKPHIRLHKKTCLLCEKFTTWS